MLTLTLKYMLSPEALAAGAPGGSDDCLYLIRDADLVLYVGKTNLGAAWRLHTHITASTGRGVGRSDLGRLIRNHALDSGAWAVDLFTVEDCREIIGRHFPDLERVPVGQLAVAVRFDSIDDAERALIREHRPALNRAENPAPRPLPATYPESTANAEAQREWRRARDTKPRRARA